MSLLPCCSDSAGGRLKILAMQLLGSNVSYLRKRQPDGLLPFGAAIHLGLQMLACVEAVHAEASNNEINQVLAALL